MDVRVQSRFHYIQLRFILLPTIFLAFAYYGMMPGIIVTIICIISAYSFRAIIKPICNSKSWNLIKAIGYLSIICLTYYCFPDILESLTLK